MNIGNFEGAPFNVYHLVPLDRLAAWRARDPDGADRDLLEASLRLGRSDPNQEPEPEERLIASHLVLAGGDEVAFVQLAATGLITTVDTFIGATVWAKRRRAAGPILNLPSVLAARNRLVEGLGPLGWETPDITAASRVMDAIRKLEGILMLWLTIRPGASETAISDFARSTISRTNFGVGDATSLT